MPLTPVSPDEFCCSHGCFYCLMTRLQFRQQCEATAEHPPLLSLFSFSVLPSFTWINQSSAAISQKLLKAQSRLSKEPVSKHATSSSSLDLPPPPLISWSYAARLITLTVNQTFLIDAEGQPIRPGQDPAGSIDAACRQLRTPSELSSACETARGEGHLGYKEPAAAAIAQAVSEICVVIHAGKLIHFLGW